MDLFCYGVHVHVVGPKMLVLFYVEGYGYMQGNVTYLGGFYQPMENDEKCN